MLAGSIELTLPGVERFHRSSEDIDASGEAFLGDRPGYFAGLG
jgi:hypothetical protein